MAESRVFSPMYLAQKLRKVPGWLSVICIFLFSVSGFTQQPELGVSVGLSNFQGDLPSYRFDGGFAIKLHPEVGLFARVPLTPMIALRGDIRYTLVSGDDALHTSEGGRQRNLHFRSPVVHGFLAAEIYPLMYFREDAPRLNLFLTGGVGLYHFNPKARYEGRWVELQPLSTEGQGLANYPEQKPYKLTQFMFPMGGGLRWEINPVWSIGAELIAFVLTTDYLDDVSTYYISYAELLEAKGPVSAALSNRQGEYLGTGPVDVESGTSRGNPSTNDFFVTGALTVQCTLDAIFLPKSQRFKKKCPKF